MDRMNILMRRLLLGFIFVISIASCTSDEEHTPPSAGGMTKVLFRMKKPNSIPVSTKALLAENEDEVKELLLLIFDKNGKYVKTYQDIDIVQTDKTVSFTTHLNNGTFNLLVVANANALVEAANLTTTDTRESVAQKLIAGMPADGMWNTDPDSQGYAPIPMCGESGTITLNGGDGAPIEFPLVRMLAKVDVSLSGTAGGKFRLTKIYVANYNRRGQVIVGANNWNNDKSGVTTASIPNNPNREEGTDNMLDYSDKIVDNKFCTSEIYLMEADHVDSYSDTSVEWSDNPCIIIGGYFKDDSSETFYRLDYVQKTGSAYNWLNILRNYKYSFMISDVSKAGYGVVEEAYHSAPVNMTYDVVDIDEGFPYNDQSGPYVLGVSHETINLPPDGLPAVDMKIMTNYYGGWSAWVFKDIAGKNRAEEDTFWLDLSLKSGGPNYSTGTSVSLLTPTGANNTDVPREAYIYIVSGRMTKVVKVVQACAEPAANSYIAKKNSYLYVPLKQLYYAIKGYGTISVTGSDTWLLGGDWISANDLPDLKAAVYWSDVDDFNTASSPVREVRLSSVPAGADVDSYLSSGYIEVGTGTSEGNAIVALWVDKDGNGKLNGNDEIKWTWHIWRVDDSVESATGWMNRNLGAQAARPVGPLDPLFGFYYQWGRKDPFIHLRPRFITDTYDNRRQSTIYFNNDVVKDFKGAVNTTSVSIETATKYPLTFYFEENTHSWLSDYDPVLFSTLWGGYTLSTGLMKHVDGFNRNKSVYDPCPAGYKLPDKEEYTRAGDFPTDYSGYTKLDAAGGYYVYGGTLGKNGAYLDVRDKGCYFTRNIEDNTDQAIIKYIDTKLKTQKMSYASIGEATQIRCLKIK